MAKLFTTLVVLLALVLVGYFFGIQNYGDMLFRTPIENKYQRAGQGTLSLLNRTVKGLSEQQRAEKLDELQRQFVYPMALLARDALTFTEHQQQRLNQGLIVQLEDDNADILYAYLPDTNLMWAIAIDQTETSDEMNTVAGTFYLLKQALEQHPPAQQPIVMKQLQSEFGFEISLKRLSDLSLDEEDMQQLATGVLIAVADDNDDGEFYLQLSNSPWVVHIPYIESPWLDRFSNQIIIAMLALFLMLASLIWVWTLWRSLSQIRQAAERFGSGEYDARVSFKPSDRLAQLSQAFNTMAEQTQGSIRSHKELTSAVSHELRTPVARMRFSLDMLADSEDTSDKERYISNMNTDMDELDSLLNELLTYARLDQGNNTANLQPEELCPWLDQVMKSLQPLSGSIALRQKCDEIATDTTACFDTVLMTRLLNNLVQNAIRYANTRVLVTILLEGEQVMLCVDDDGEGIPEQDRERLFEAFATQDSSRNKASDGFGLGLAIVKRITDAHNGHVEIQDSPLGGARFCVSWPSEA